MTSEERIRKQKELVETMGRAYEKEGLPPIAGRIMGLLLIMDKDKFTFDEIVEELQISKGSASTALKILELRNDIDYITLPGDRKRYFRIKTINKLTMIDDQENKLIKTRTFLQSALDLKASHSAESSLFLKDLIHMLDFFLTKFGELKKEYLSQR